PPSGFWDSFSSQPRSEKVTAAHKPGNHQIFPSTAYQIQEFASGRRDRNQGKAVSRFPAHFAGTTGTLEKLAGKRSTPAARSDPWSVHGAGDLGHHLGPGLQHFRFVAEMMPCALPQKVPFGEPPFWTLQ